ncbi:MAG TPA: succinate dehydrogenase/fumarate reductase flavoprotein subunit, partial [Candidatus Competibacteraceae bacterium]|nr:succinate dehydrogenase/fumarate reductase flavoprotein subunit [Candidatus Competibacteraceae bacterium]
WGDCVLLDMRHLGEKKINERLPFVRDLSISYLGMDPVKEPIPIRPVVHYCMGGIHTDINAATPVAGLFAAGECACVSINGANRLGSNSLTELLVFGRKAAMSAIEHLKSAPGSNNASALAAKAQESEARIRALFDKSGAKESISGLRNEMMHTLEEGAGIYRTGDRLAATCAKLAELRQRYADIEVHDKSKVYNTDLLQALELGSMLDCAETVAVGGRDRKESRGAHQRLDFTERDDNNFLKHTLSYHHPKEPPRLDYLDVVITKSKPGVRDYSGAHK